MLFRSTTGADLDRVLACTIIEPISWIPADRYRSELADQQYRPEWTWIAEDSDQILARALWWGLPGSAHPLALDCVYVHDSVTDRIGFAAALLTAGHDAFRAQGAPKLPQYDLNLPNGWRGDPAVSAAVGWRRARRPLRRTRTAPLRVDPRCRPAGLRRTTDLHARTRR